MPTVKRDEVVAMFTALGVDVASTWDVGTMAKKVAGVSKFMEPDFEFKNPADKAVFEKLAEAEKTASKVTIEGFPQPKPKPKPGTDVDAKTKPSKTKPAPATKARGSGTNPNTGGKKAPKGTATGTWAGYDRYVENPLPFSETRGDGVLKFIVDVLKDAGAKNKPLTKEEIHEKMVKKFPNRDKDKMMTTLTNQIPSRLRIVRGIHVWKTKEVGKDTRYFIKGDGGKPQPKEEPKPAPAAKAPAKPAAKPQPKKPAAKPAVKK